MVADGRIAYGRSREPLAAICYLPSAISYQPSAKLALATADRAIRQIVSLSHSLLQNSYENAKNGPTFMNFGTVFRFFPEIPDVPEFNSGTSGGP
jgi:hypothetical protein